MSTAAVSVDEFQALEQKVMRTIELIKKEREARATAEAQLAELKQQLSEESLMSSTAQAEVETLLRERQSVKLRVEKMLQQMDELL